jgi:hypothetical protein
MIAPESKQPTAQRPTGADDLDDGNGRSDQPLTRLRGAGVDVDVRRAGQAVLGVCMAALAITFVILLVAGIQKNDQITSLRQHGIPVRITVSGCVGLMGGSGSNLAGYACSGTYTVNGHQYHEDIPGTDLHLPGSTMPGVTVPGDPRLLSTPATVAGEHASWRVFIAPGIILAALALLTGVVIRSRRHRGVSEPAGPR